MATVDLREKLKNMSDAEIKELCNDIYDWEHSKDGVLNKETKYRKLFDEYEAAIFSVVHLRDVVLNEALNRFEKVSAVVFRHYAGYMIR